MLSIMQNIIFANILICIALTSSNLLRIFQSSLKENNTKISVKGISLHAINRDLMIKH